MALRGCRAPGSINTGADLLQEKRRSAARRDARSRPGNRTNRAELSTTPTKMQHVVWLSAALALCVFGSVVEGRCWDPADCNDLDSQDDTILCIWQCTVKQLVRNTERQLPNQQKSSEEDDGVETEEDRSSHSILLSALATSDASLEQLPSVRPQRSDERPPYSMQHFRWGKPMSRKRRPVKVHTSISMDDEDHEEPSVETPFLSLNKRQLENSKEHARKNANTKSTTKYRITHFRWSAPHAAKRYGGFMKTWSEPSHKALLTLFRNIMIKNGQ